MPSLRGVAGWPEVGSGEEYMEKSMVTTYVVDNESTKPFQTLLDVQLQIVLRAP
jgi:hypothetical protein